MIQSPQIYKYLFRSFLTMNFTSLLTNWFYKVSPLFLALTFSTYIGNAQPTIGTTGLLNIPTANMQPDGTIVIGGNYLPEIITPARFSYNTGNYYFDITFLPFLEINYRLTFIKSPKTGKYNNQERTFAIRAKILNEFKYLPAIVVGSNDVFNPALSIEKQNFGYLYTVTSKNFNIKGNKFSTTIGYGFDLFKKGQNTGLFGGISFTPANPGELSFMAEYDSEAINAGLSLLILDQIKLYVFAYDLKYFCGGIMYKINLKDSRTFYQKLINQAKE